MTPTATTEPPTSDSAITASVAATFDAYEPDVREALLKLRTLVLSTAKETEGVGSIEETLKWGQPSYLTTESGSGSTVRIAPTSQRSDHDFALFFICHTNLVDQFKDLFGDTFTYDGGRALVFSLGDELPEDEIQQCIAMALTYHRP